MGECRCNTKMSRGTSNFPLGNAQKHTASDLSKSRVNLIGGGGLINAKWMDDIYDADSSRSRQKLDKCGSNQSNSDFDNEHRLHPVCQYLIYQNIGLNVLDT